jgi:hypothetical protein
MTKSAIYGRVQYRILRRQTATADQRRESVMQVAMFLILLLLRMIAGIVTLLLADLAIHFVPLLLALLLGMFSNHTGSSESNLGKWLDMHMYHRWTGVWACFLLQLMLCASIDVVTGRLPWFAGLPVIARAIGCSAALLVGTLVLVILSRSSEAPTGYLFETDFKRGPSWGDFNITWSEVFILSPLFVSEFLRDRLRI